MANEDSKPTKKELKRKHDIVVDDKKIKKEPTVWTDDEDELLREACANVADLKDVDWKDLCNKLNNKSYTQALHRWQKVLDPKLVKGSWSNEEDETLKQLVAKHGPKNWSVIASHLNGRIGKQCRERWYNHLAPEIRKDPWTADEDRIILNFHSKFGNKWSDLAKLLPGRPSNAIKNHWNSTLRRRVQDDEITGRSKKLKSIKQQTTATTEPLCDYTDMYIEEMNGLLAIKSENSDNTTWARSSYEDLLDAPLIPMSHPCNPNIKSSVSELFNNTFAQIESEVFEEDVYSNNWMEDTERSTVMTNVIDLNYNNQFVNPYFPMQQQFAVPMVAGNFVYNNFGQLVPVVFTNQFGIQPNFPIYGSDLNQQARMTY